MAACLMTTSLALAAEPTGKAGDWPQWRGPNRDGVSLEKGLSDDWEKNPPKLLWKAEGMGAGYASVSIVGDRLYTSGNTDEAQTVTAVDLNDKKVLWTVKITNEVPKHGYEGARTTPTVDGDRLYAVASDGALVCLKTEDGGQVWRKEFKEFGGKMMSGWGFSESPLVDGDRVVCTPGGNDAMLVAFDKASGDVVWKAAMPSIGEAGKDGAGYSSIVVSEALGVRQYVQLVGRGVIGVAAKDGKFLWGYNKIANGVANIPTPIVKDNFVFTSTGYGEGGSALLKLKKKGPGVEAEEVYYHKANELQNHHGGMVLVGKHVYMGNGHNNGFPVCVDFMTGKIVWGGKIRGAGQRSAAVTAADGDIIFRYESGEVALVAATPKGYNLKGTFRPEVTISPCWSHPVVSDGKLYLRDQDTLMVYDVSGK